ncbi:uncharacterized protein LOC113290299 [Papaver somniferum]|uniref:uncharacterized protein LOC113290299 n=1 Tax=Papaver somniferum TaxID=3469 RepID=UPI000E6F57B8|nr:uncharacterized protein LOC113290299 [Papaver somniferum]XP_026395701.1 uncharacterized protein LOC113290299 [Papaver somniferum]
MLGNRAAMDKTLGIFRHSFSLLTRRNFSASAIPSSTGGGGEATVSALQKPKRKKKKNLFEVAQFLPNWGIGYQMAKTHWSGVSYQITKINLYKDGKHGKAWGIVHKEGRPAADAPKKISGVHKRGWKYIPNSKMKEENIVKSAAEVQTA